MSDQYCSNLWRGISGTTAVIVSIEKDLSDSRCVHAKSLTTVSSGISKTFATSRIAERLRQLVEIHPIRAYDEVLSQTVSIGVAGFPDEAQALEALIERADQALYAAKRAGRNRVVRWSDAVVHSASSHG